MRSPTTRILLGVVLALSGGASHASTPAGAPGGPAGGRAATHPFFDAHAHPDPAHLRDSVAAALRALDAGVADRIAFMPPPFTAEDPARYDAEPVLAAVNGHGDRLVVLGGGGTLNAMIHESVRSGDAGPAVRRRFRDRAEELLRAGVAGFGELAAEHFQGATRYQSAPADHPLFLLLADVAAEHGVPIVLHLEAIPEPMSLPAGLRSPPHPARLEPDLPAFERLLAHDRRARIVWAHAGWDSTGYRTPTLCRRLLAAHPNLSMDVKVDPERPGRNPLLAGGGGPGVDPAWLQLLRDFPDRFVVGTDQHYPEPDVPTQRSQAMAVLLEALPADLRQAIGAENAARLLSRARRRGP